MGMGSVTLPRQFFILCLYRKPKANLLNYVPQRFRYKKKWAVHLKPATNCQLALNHFDAFYKPFYGDKWPLIRLSLLSLPKHCAVVNNFADSDKVETQLEDMGTVNFVKRGKEIQDRIKADMSNSSNVPGIGMDTDRGNFGLSHHDDSKLRNAAFAAPVTNNYVSESQPFSEDHVMTSADEMEPLYDDLYKDDLNIFVPTEQVISERDQLRKDEMTMSSFQPRDISISVLPWSSLMNLADVKAFVFPSRDVTKFPPAKSLNRRFGYYLMDAASVLPALALNVQPTDQVLDLCAAPGGKSVIILQSLDLLAGGSLTCNDSSRSRVGRLKTVLHSYFPTEIADRVLVTQEDGTIPRVPMYNKILVDVPCNADRHVATEDDNNLFKVSRTRDRLDLMEIQKDLLVTALRSCAVNGDVVYSTCTLAPAQNDGVIQAAVEELCETSEIQVAVEGLSNFARMFSDTFMFHEKSRFGQLILPTLTNNFGPTYFAKLKRIK